MKILNKREQFIKDLNSLKDNWNNENYSGIENIKDAGSNFVLYFNDNFLPSGLIDMLNTLLKENKLYYAITINPENKIILIIDCKF